MVLLNCEYCGLLAPSQDAMKTHVKKLHVSEIWGPVFVLPKNKKARNKQSCFRALLNELNQFRNALVTADESLGKGINTAFDGCQASYIHINFGVYYDINLCPDTNDCDSTENDVTLKHTEM